jgi:hypothetical protein
MQEAYADASSRFRWAALQLHSIRSLKILRPSYISAALHEMPRTLDGTHDRVLSAIDDQYSDEAKTALYWLAFSARPITVAELAEACSIRIEHNEEPSLEDGGYEAITGLLDVISSFVLLGKPEDTRDSGIGEPWPHKFVKDSYGPVRLAHFSVKEYLISARLRDRNLQFSKYWLDQSIAHRVLGQMCSAYFLFFTEEPRVKIWIDEEKAPYRHYFNALTSYMMVSAQDYLSHFHYDEYDDTVVLHAHLVPQDYLEDMNLAFPLLKYACNYWHEHQKIAESWSGPLREHERLHFQILEDERVRVAWLRLEDRDGERYMHGFPNTQLIIADKLSVHWHDRTQALYWAVSLGLSETVLLLYNREPKPDVNHVAGKYEFPLQVAASKGDNDMVNLLIDKGANPNLKGGYYGTALQAAVERGYERVVENLLQAGADPNCEVQRGPSMRYQIQPKVTDTLLIVAGKSRNIKVVQMMIQFGANIDLTSPELLSGSRLRK